MGQGRRIAGWAVRILGGLLAAAGLLAVGSVMLSGRRDAPPPADDDSGLQTPQPTPAAWDTWDGTVVFLGDSITESCDLKTYYPGLNAVNEGVSGDTSEGIAGRLDQAVFAYSPEVLVLHGGINDVLQEWDDEFVVGQLRTAIQAVRQRLPDTKIILQSIYPVEEGEDPRFTNHILNINSELQAMAEEQGALYVDVFSALKTPDDRLDARYSDDGLHLNAAGYEAVRPVLTEALTQAIGLGPAAPQTEE